MNKRFSFLSKLGRTVVVNIFLFVKGNDKTEVMVLDSLPQENVEKLSDKAFKEMKSLRILIIKDAIYSEVLQHLPNSLRVLDWSGYPSWCLRPDFVKLPSNCLIFNKFKVFEMSCVILIQNGTTKLMVNIVQIHS